MIDGWVRKGLLVMVLGVAIILGRIDGLAQIRADLARPAIGNSQELNHELFEAVRSWLAEAHVAQQDMPKRIISVERMGSDRWKVRMQMVQGEAWFEVWRDGDIWRVKGLPVPSHGGGA